MGLFIHAADTTYGPRETGAGDATHVQQAQFRTAAAKAIDPSHDHSPLDDNVATSELRNP